MATRLNLLIAGAQKTGTTSLHDMLGQHPDIFMTGEKDFFAFNSDPNYGVQPDDLPRFLAGYAGEAVAGTSNVLVLPYHDTFAPIRRYNPAIRLIVMLRQPADRAHSAYWMMRRRAREPCPDFMAALRLDEARRSDDFRADSELRYVHHGLYHRHLAALLDCFPREQVYIGLFEDMVGDTQAFMDDLFRWLGLPSWPVQATRLNTAAMPKSELLQKILYEQSRLRRLYVALTPRRLRRGVVRALSPVMRMNERPFKYPRLPDADRREATSLFGPSAEPRRLIEMFGRNVYPAPGAVRNAQRVSA